MGDDSILDFYQSQILHLGFPVSTFRRSRSSCGRRYEVVRVAVGIACLGKLLVGLLQYRCQLLLILVVA
ncbi:MAG: hypothetical protein V7K35_19020 [Nostoc sp.]